MYSCSFDSITWLVSSNKTLLAALLLASRDLIGGAEWVKANASDENIGKTAEKAKKNFAGTEIFGKTIAVIGLGAIGILVANAAIDLGMKVVGYDPYLSTENALKLNSKVKYTTDLKAAVRDADFVTIHVPAMDSTKGMINAENTLQKGNNNKRVWGIGREGTWIEVKFPFKQF